MPHVSCMVDFPLAQGLALPDAPSIPMWALLVLPSHGCWIRAGSRQRQSSKTFLMLPAHCTPWFSLFALGLGPAGLEDPSPCVPSRSHLL